MLYRFGDRPPFVEAVAKMSDPEASADAGSRRGRRSGGGAEARRAQRSAAGQGPQLTYIKRNIPLYEVLTEDGLSLIENNAETVLQEIGIDFRDDPEALAMWKRRRRRRQGRPRALSQGPRALADQDGAARIHPVCPQPGPQRR